MPHAADTATIAKTVADFLTEHTRQEVSDYGEDIFAAGHVNSLFAMQLVLFVETTFDFTLDAEDLEFDNFRSITSITDLVARKLALVP